MSLFSQALHCLLGYGHRIRDKDFLNGEPVPDLLLLRMPGCTHHFNVVKDSRHLLYSLHHLLRIIGIFCFSRHLFIKRHLPAHCWVLHLKYNTSMCIMNKMNRFIQECVYYLLSISKEIKSLPTLPCRCRLLCKNSLTSSSVSFYELKKPRFGGHL